MNNPFKMILIAAAVSVLLASLITWKVTRKYYQGEVAKYKLQAQAWEQVAKRMEEDIKSGAKYRVEASIVRERYYNAYYKTQQCFDQSQGNGTECLTLLKEDMTKMREELLGKKK